MQPDLIVPSPDELNRLVALFQAGRHGELEAQARQLLERFPEHGFGWKLLSAALHLQGKNSFSALQKAVQYLPHDAELHSNLGNELLDRGQAAQAIESYRRALAIRPDLAEAHYNLGVALKDLGLLEVAGESYRRALDLKPDYAEAWNNLGIVLMELGRSEEAEASYRRVLLLQPGHALAHSNLGNALQAQGRFEEAVSSYRRALELDPGYADAYGSLGNVLRHLGHIDAALDCIRRAMELGHADPYSRFLFMRNCSESHADPSWLDQAREFGRMVSWKAAERFAGWLCEAEPSRLRVGMVSGDYTNHPVGYFLEGLLAAMDPERIELIAYTTGSRSDDLTERIRPHFAGWKSLVGLNDKAAAQLIHDDGIHVLLDLAGHTAMNRLPVFAWKPAPVQASWLGYFATTGVAEMDYLLADEVGVPEARRGDFTERVWYLPDTRLCFTPPAYELAVSPLPALVKGHVTFGCFQRLDKVNDAVLAVWGRILGALPDSRLRWQCKWFGDATVKAGLSERLRQHGIDPARVDLVGPAPRRDYLAAHAEVDMTLDTFPYTGGTTTCEALWMGVPTVTLAGGTLLARQGASLLTAAGLDDWVAESEDEYVAKALGFAADLESLSRLRAELRERVLASPVFDAGRFARNFEDALWGMWRNRSEGQDNDTARAGDGEIASPSIEIVSATRLSESEFWNESALGQSLRSLAFDKRLVAHIAFENRRGLPEVFNERVESQDCSDTLVFIHDDVWIDDYAFADRLLEGLKHYDVIGVAGNRRRVRNQPGWAHMDEKLTPDSSFNLSGFIAHGKNRFGVNMRYGETPAECELLDGVILAARKSCLQRSGVRFDPRFDFHFYDLDFCRSARSKGLHLGTWPIALTHQSGGAFGSEHWRAKCAVYLDKWRSEDDAPPHVSEEADRDNYAEWVRRYDAVTEEVRASMLGRIEGFSHRPVFSLLMPVPECRPDLLGKTLDSVRAQVYPHWELCVHVGGTVSPALRAVLESHAGVDARIRLSFQDPDAEEPASCNIALGEANGDWAAVLRPGDLLAEQALFWMADAIERHPDARMIYSDEDRVDDSGSLLEPCFKCDWNLDLFYSHDYVGQLCAFDTGLMRDAGGFRPEFGEAQAYDLALRCIERIRSTQINHVPRVLYHGRADGQAGSSRVVTTAGAKALGEHFRRMNVPVAVDMTAHAYRVRYALPEPAPMVSLIVPTRNGVELLRQCIASILDKTDYPAYEIIVVDNGSDDPETLAYLHALGAEARVRVVRDERPFNFSALNNAAVKLARGTLIGLVNDDIEVISPDWLSEMAGQAIQPGVGAVGAKLLFPDDTIQHAGLILDLTRVAVLIHRDLTRDDAGYSGRAALAQDFSAVTAACLVVKKSIYEEIGGLNEAHLQVAYNDVDFCLRLGRAGYRNVWTPHAVLYHHESATRGYENTLEKKLRFADEMIYMKLRWYDWLKRDPAFSPNLMLENGRCRLAWPPAIQVTG